MCDSNLVELGGVSEGQTPPTDKCKVEGVTITSIRALSHKSLLDLEILDAGYDINSRIIEVDRTTN